MLHTPLMGFAILLVLQSLGELLSRGLGLPVPGPVLGMVMLIVVLQVRALREAVRLCAEAILGHLSLLFVPIAVGVSSYLGLLRQHGWALAVILLVSAWVGLAVTVLAMRWLPGAPE